MMINIIIAFFISYIIGAIPFAFILTRFMTGKDVRKIGSGNVGATNASRAMGFKYGVLVALLDLLKGYVAVSLTKIILPDNLASYYLLGASLLIIIGHNWSVFLSFSGGKGVATTLGVFLNLVPLTFVIFIIVWFTVVILTKYVSLASILGALSSPIISIIFYNNSYITLFSCLVAILIILRHYSNLNRLIRGRERRFSFPPGKKNKEG